MNLKAQLEEMTIQRNYHEVAGNRARAELNRARAELALRDKEIEQRNNKIKEQAEQIHWLKQMNQTLTRKIPNYAGA